MLRYYDFDGTERDEAWARELFGVQNVHVPDVEEAYRLVELRAATAPKGEWALTATVRDVDGQAAPGVRVALAPRDVAGTAAIRGANDAGQASFPLGNEHLYSPFDDHGHYLVTVHPGDGGGDVWNTCGVVLRQNRWLNPTFQWGGYEPPPEPPGPGPEPEPPTDFEAAVLARLDRIIELIEG